MATLQQASQHYAWLQEQANNQARLEAERAAQLAGINAAATNQQAAIQAQREAAANIYAQQQEQQRGLITSQLAAQQQIGQERQQVIGGQLQSALSAQGAQQQAGLQAQHFDLQAQFNQIQLTQSEQMRMQRLRNGIDAVKNHPGLSPDEKQNLIMQMQTGLNPLEQRQQQANILHTQIQTQGQAQQNEQQATLFNQRQNFLARGLQGNLQTIEDPSTGVRQLFFMNADGNPQMLDFGRLQESHYLQMAQGIQGLSQRQQMFPGQLEQQGAQLEATRAGTQQTLAETARTRTLTPAQLANLQATTGHTQAQTEHIQQMTGPQVANLLAQTHDTTTRMNIAATLMPAQLEQYQAHTDSMIQQTQERRDLAPWQRNLLIGRIQAQKVETENAALNGPLQRQHTQAAIGRIQAENQLTAQQTEQLRIANEQGVPVNVLGTLASHVAESVNRNIQMQVPRQNASRLFPYPEGATAEQRATVDRQRQDYINNYSTTEFERQMDTLMRPFRRRVGGQGAPGGQGMGAPNAGPQPGPRPQNGQQLLAQFEQDAQGAPLQPEPQAANALEPILATVNRHYGATGILDSDRPILRNMRNLLQAAHQRNTGMTPAEQASYQRDWQYLHDAGGDSRRMAENMRLPGQQDRYVSNPEQLQSIANRLATGRSILSPFVTASIDSMRVELQRAIRAGRGLTPGEVQEYNRLREHLGQNRSSHGRLYDQTALPER